MALSKIDPAGLDIGQIGGRRNLIINGAMQVAQRGTSSTATSYQTVDRIQPVYSGGALTQSQDTNAPDGFSNSFKWSCTTAANPLTSGQYAAWYYKIEGQDLQHLKYGTASAQSVTLSFWVKSNLTGTFQVNLENSDNNRRYGETYTVNSADTWEYKTVTYSGDTVGALDNDNASSLRLEFWVAAGSTWTGGSASQAWETSNNPNRAGSLTASLLSSTSNYIQYTGLQLEVGSVATPFEHRSFGEEMELCKRYYQKSFDYGTVPAFDTSENQVGISMAYNASTATGGAIELGVEMRTTPTVTYYSRNVTTGNYWGMYKNTTWTVTTTGNNGSRSKRIQFYVQPSGGGMTAQNVYELSGNWTAEAEL